MSRTMLRIVVALLLVFGAQLWLNLGNGFWGRNFQLTGFVILILVAFAGPVRRMLPWMIDRLNGVCVSRRGIVAGSVGVLGGVYLVFTAFHNYRIFEPLVADDFGYLLQTRMLADGHLWLPQHPLADFFESIHVLVKPAYTSIYFPGAAMLFVPQVWFGLPTWVIPVIASAVIVGLTYRVVAELFSDFEGLLAALMLVSLNWFRICSTMIASRIPSMLFGMIATWAWLRWRRSRDWRWTIVVGVFCGWCAVTRPLDALCFALPIGIVMIWDTIRLDPRPTPGLAKLVVCGVAGVAPFLILQVVINYNVTGQLLRSPFTEYADRDYPGTSYGLHKFDPTTRPVSALKSKQDAYDLWVVPFVKGVQPDTILRTWATDRLPTTVQCTLPHTFFLLLVPLGFLSLQGRRWVVAGVLITFVAGYFFYAFFLQPYTVMAAPAMAVLALAGRRVLIAVYPVRGWTNAFVTLSMVWLSMTALPEFNRIVNDTPIPYALREVDETLVKIDRPAVVLFHYDDKARDFGKWPVYNVDVSNPDDALLIRANDLGARNQELYRYYATRSPERTVYRYDLATDQVKRLGTVADLAKSGD